MAATGRLRNITVLAASYAAICLPMFALWEIAQLPLYTMWADRGVRASLWAALHCTLGDVAIAVLTLLGAVLSTAFAPGHRTTRRIAAITVLLGVVVTAAIEVASTQWLHRWAYGPLMPVDPFFGIGLSPLAQWIVVPASALSLVRRRSAELLRADSL
jgi:hypothetical protein